MTSTRTAERRRRRSHPLPLRPRDTASTRTSARRARAHAWRAEERSAGGGGYDLDAVRRAWSMEYLIMLGAPVPEALHDDDPPVLGGRARTAVDAATDQATNEALAAAFT